MALSTSKIAPTTNKIARELDEIYKDLHELDFAIQVPKTLDKKNSLQREKQISVDPISLRESSMGEISFNMMLPPQAESDYPLPPPLLPAKHKFLSCSLPNSATSSPRFGSRKNLKHESQALPQQVDELVNKDPSLQNTTFWRSKSCGDGRTYGPPDELDDLWMYKHHRHGGLISKPNVNNEEMDGSNEVDFKCGALCLLLPGFTKAKQVRTRKREPRVKENNVNVISRTVSLEKFECGSWASSTIIPDHDVGDLYFDLPLELINNLGNDAHLPVSTAFVFDNKDVKGVLKNGSNQTRSTTTTTGGRKSHESSSRHVRFSTSSPTSYPASPASCITPRLRKARDDFNAFLEAQSA
ncbi:hypothetical protein Golob_022757 [Gossypium lobatum]|uniref:Uncharacterized protein n=1 Tax=Gossypium lobatum TaxID=34289 RepID=A0A7J8LHN5_9ROSI|nr:hypothetical protein [Gossypium lobatum]